MPPCGGHRQRCRYNRRRREVSSRAPVWGASGRTPTAPATRQSFKSCPRVGGITGAGENDIHISVSSRAPVWGASPTKARNSSIKEFQVVPPCGGHPESDGDASSADSGFKSCPRVGGIRFEDGLGLRSSMFQVVPPCGGHRRQWSWGGRTGWVSSRAPVWGASAAASRPRAFLKFQVVPPCGGHRALQQPRCPPKSSFKSCPRVGGIREARGSERRTDVSSRAPVWGASTPAALSVARNASFKSCPRVGGISVACMWRRTSTSFKSCPRVGGIALVPHDVADGFGFKSCPRVGGIIHHLPLCEVL